MRVGVGAEARQEIADAALWYHREKPGLGAEFRLEARDAIERIREAPACFSTIDDGIRRCRVHRFPYGVVYEVHDDHIDIVAVMHLHRRPDYWKDRS